MCHCNEWGLLKLIAFCSYFCFLSVSRMKCRLFYRPFSWGVLANICAVPRRDNFRVRLHCLWPSAVSFWKSQKKTPELLWMFPLWIFFFITQTAFIMLQLVNAIIWCCTFKELSDQKADSFIIVNLFIKQWSGVSTCIKKKKKDKTKTTNQDSNPQILQPTSYLFWWTIRTYIASNSIHLSGE